MPSRVIKNEADRDMAVKWIAAMKPPFRLSAEPGSLRSLEQNSLSHAWYKEIADQRGDMTFSEVRAECKLVFGVPILREENEEFRSIYDRKIKGWTYEEKLEFIQHTELPVTRIMTTKQLTRYLDTMQAHFAKQGIQLTAPADQEGASLAGGPGPAADAEAGPSFPEDGPADPSELWRATRDAMIETIETHPWQSADELRDWLQSKQGVLKAMADAGHADWAGEIQTACAKKDEAMNPLTAGEML